MKGTIIEKVDIPDSQKALIPVPVKDTMSHYWLSLTRGRTLIPVPTKGMINRSLIIGIRQECFNPRTYEGYDMKAEERPYLICALIPVPMKGTIPERLVSGFKVDSL